MAICRVEKTKNYTTMSNYHLDDKNLSLKAIGLLSKMLRLPDDWNFSIKGLAAICKDGQDSISSAIKELEKNHYIRRERERVSSGMLGDVIYYVYEIPYDIDKSLIEKSEFVCSKKNSETCTNKGFLPKRENPVQVNPEQVKPKQVSPDLVNPKQVNPDLDLRSQINNNKTNTFQPITYQSINPEQGIPSNRMDELNPEEVKERLIDLKEQFNFEHIKYLSQLLDEELENGNIELEEYDKKWINTEYAESILLGLAEALSFESDSVICQGKKICLKEIFLEKIKLLNEFDFKKILKTIYDVRPKNKQLYAIKTIYTY